MNKLLLISGLLFSVFGIKAQEDFGKSKTPSLVVQEEPKNDVKSLWNELQGTFQIIYSENTQKILITNELLLNIRTSRKDTEDTTIVINQDVRVFIPSKQQVLSPSFQPLQTEKFNNK